MRIYIWPMAAALALPMAAHAADSTPRTLDVSAQASIEQKPDQAIISAQLTETTPAVAQGDVPDPKALKKARLKLEQRMSQLLASLEKHHIPQSAIQAGNLKIAPENLYERDGPLRTHTQLRRSITVTTAPDDTVVNTLDALTEVNANQIDGIEYTVRNRQAAEDKALAQALERARNKAHLMATTVGAKLGVLLSAEEHNSGRPQILKSAAPQRMAAMSDAYAASGDYTPGNINVESGVSTRWSLLP